MSADSGPESQIEEVKSVSQQNNEIVLQDKTVLRQRKVTEGPVLIIPGSGRGYPQGFTSKKETDFPPLDLFPGVVPGGADDTRHSAFLPDDSNVSQSTFSLQKKSKEVSCALNSIGVRFVGIADYVAGYFARRQRGGEQ